MTVPDLLPHPVTGQLFPSPVPPGEGWPGDPADRHTAVARGREDVAAWKSVANLQNVLPIAPDQLNTYDVLNSDDVVFSVEALNAFVHGPAEAAQEESK